jgi:hypothetical protein
VVSAKAPRGASKLVIRTGWRVKVHGSPSRDEQTIPAAPLNGLPYALYRVICGRCMCVARACDGRARLADLGAQLAPSPVPGRPRFSLVAASVVPSFILHRPATEPLPARVGL